MEHFLRQLVVELFTIRDARMLHNDLLLEAKRARDFFFFAFISSLFFFSKNTNRRGIMSRRLVKKVFVEGN